MKPRLTILLFTALAFTGISLQDWAHPVAGLAEAFRIGAVTTNVNLRKTPGLQGDVVAGLQQGSPVKVYGEKDGWYRVSAEKNYMLFNGWVYNRYVEIVTAQDVEALPEPQSPKPLPAAQPKKTLPDPVKTSPPPEATTSLRPPVVRTPTPKMTPEPEKKAAAQAPQQAVPVEKSAPPAVQKSSPAPPTKKTAPVSGAKPAGTVRLLLSISPLVLAIIALLVAVKAFRIAQGSARKVESPTAPPAEELAIERPPLTPVTPPVIERRHSPRANRLIEVDFAVDGKFFRGFINNLSETGAYVDTPEGFNVGQEITISCPVIDTGGYSKRVGLIVRLTETGIAVHFQQSEMP